MSNKDNLIIQPSDEIISHTALQSDVIVFNEEKRQKVIQILRQIPAFLDGVKKLSEGKTYQAHFPPEVWERIKNGSARLDKKDNGLFGALIRDVETGHVTNHVSLKEVSPDLLSSLNQLATQQTLANIVQRLEVIDEKITYILQGQINDRLAEVESGIHLYEQAIAASDPDRRELIHSAISKLTDGRDKLIKSTDFSFIDKLPRNRLGMFFSINWDIPKEVQSKAEPVWKAFHAIVEASRYLVLAYSALNQPNSLRVSLEQVESKVKVFQDKMGKIVNMLPPTSNWRESLMAFSQGVLPNIRDLDDISQKTIVVEFQPKEIAPPEGV
ncbi:MAG: hypothetical protein QY328_10315 [Anaerolineales bacterium]|nr:MAG: hypothetical protein QY328_10315 [Anaerolineales bacterium]